MLLPGLCSSKDQLHAFQLLPALPMLLPLLSFLPEHGMSILPDESCTVSKRPFIIRLCCHEINVPDKCYNVLYGNIHMYHPVHPARSVLYLLTLNFVTFAPTFTTSPATSCPRPIFWFGSFGGINGPNSNP